MKSVRILGVIAFIGLLIPDGLLGQTSVEARTKSAKSCAELFGALFGAVKHDEQLNQLGVRETQIGQGNFFISKTGKTVHRSFADVKPATLKFGAVTETEASLKALVADAAKRNESVIVEGDVPLEELVGAVKRAELGPLEKHVFVSLDSRSRIAQAKRRLLDRKFQQVEIVIDLPAGAIAPLFEQRVAVVGAVTLPKAAAGVRVLTPSQLTAGKSMAEALKSSRPEPGVLRISVAHHSAGIAHLSDKSMLPVADLYAARMKDGGSECFLGCNLTYEPGQWFVYDGKLLAEEVAALAADLSAKLGKSHEASGRELLELVSGRVFDETSKTGTSTGQVKRRNGFKLLEIVALGVLSGVATAAAEDGEDDQEKAGPTQGGKKTTKGTRLSKGTFASGLLELSAGKYRVSANQPWFLAEGLLERLQRAAGENLRERAVLYYDPPTDSFMFFPASATPRADIPAPLTTCKVKAKLAPGDKEALKERAGDFWFYLAATSDDAFTPRERLLKWQEQVGIKLPFIFIPFESRPKLADWTLLKPFLKQVTHTGVLLPTSAAEAHQCGLFWCEQHHTSERLSAYTKLIDGFAAAKPTPASVPLTGDCAPALRGLFSDGEVNAWLLGVWNDRRLRRPEGDLENASWVPANACDARATFLSAYPVARPVEGRYYENRSHELLAGSLPPLIQAAADGANFNAVEAPLGKLIGELREKGGVIGVSSCGKYLIISE